jgi:ribosome recycling factor
MDIEEILQKTRDLMTKSVEYYKSQLSKVRTGRASASLVDNIKVDYYGSPTPISQIAGISVPDARTIMIQPWDTSQLQPIEKAIQSADLGFNPRSDGVVLRIPVPPLTEERRKEFVKLSKKFSEEGKIAVRNIRRDQVEVSRKAEKDKQITEDDKKHLEEQIQKITDDYIKQIDVILTQKEKDLMEN